MERQGIGRCKTVSEKISDKMITRMGYCYAGMLMVSSTERRRLTSEIMGGVGMTTVLCKVGSRIDARWKMTGGCENC